MQEAKTALWHHLQNLMAEAWGGENLSRLASEAKIGVATAARIKNSETSVGLDVLDKVAGVFGVEAWQLTCVLFLSENGLTNRSTCGILRL